MKKQIIDTILHKMVTTQITPYKLGKITKISPQTIHNMLSGKDFTIDRLIKVCQALDLNLNIESK